MTENIDVSIASDYASVTIPNGDNFYYGYEVAICDGCGKTVCDLCNECEDADRQWCFVATIDGKETVIPSNELGGKGSHFSVIKNLIRGMAKIIEIQKATTPKINHNFE